MREVQKMANEKRLIDANALLEWKKTVGERMKSVNFITASIGWKLELRKSKKCMVFLPM